MKHRLWLDEANEVLWMKLVGHCTIQDLRLLCERCRLLAQDRLPTKAVIDLSDIESFPDEEVRGELVEEIRSRGFKQVGVIASRPEVKMVGMVLVQLLGEYASTEFFQEEQKALKWLANAMCGTR